MKGGEMAKRRGGSKRRASSKVGRFKNNVVVRAYDMCDKCFF
jgi:hypothetical protein